MSDIRAKFFQEGAKILLTAAIVGGDAVVKKATFQDRQRFPDEWQDFAKSLPAVDGTPLASMPTLTGALRESLEVVGIRTVEQLVDAETPIIARVLGGDIVQKKALEFLKTFSQQSRQVARGGQPPPRAG